MFPSDQLPENRPGFFQAAAAHNFLGWSAAAIEEVACDRHAPLPRRFAAFHALSGHWRPPPIAHIQSVFRDLDPIGQRFLCKAIPAYRSPESEALLRALLDVGTYDHLVKEQIYQSLMRLRSPAAHTYALHRLDAPNESDRRLPLAYLLEVGEPHAVERALREFTTLERSARESIRCDFSFSGRALPAAVVAVEERDLQRMQDAGLGVDTAGPGQTLSETLRRRLQLATDLAIAGSGLALRELRERLTAPASRDDRLLAIIIAGDAYERWSGEHLPQEERPEDLAEDPQLKAILAWIDSCLDDPA